MPTVHPSEMKGTKKQVGVWLRVSTEEQVSGDSPKHHEERARAFALAKDWDIVEVYRLDAVSGKSVIEHPEALRMVDDIEQGKISGLIFSKLARLARNTRELLEISDIFRAHNADLISLQESIDTSSPAGRLFFTVIAAMAEWEREEIAERVRASVPIRAKLGKPLGGAPTFGYTRQDGKLVPDPKEAPIRKLVYELYSEHKRVLTVANELNKRGYRTRKGAKFSTTSVKRLLQDPTAKGEKIANYSKSMGDGKAWELKPEEDWVRIPVEPIVSEELWDECNRLLVETASRYPQARRGKKTVYLFSGYLFCGPCGDGVKMYGQTGSGKYRCFKCSTKIAMDDLEALFLEQLKGFFLSDEAIVACMAENKKETKSRGKLIRNQEKELRTIERQIDSLVELYQGGALSMGAIKGKIEPLQERKEQIVEHLPNLQAELKLLESTTLSQGELSSQGKTLIERWPKLSWQEKRDIVDDLISSVTIDDNEVEFDINYVPGQLTEV